MAESRVLAGRRIFPIGLGAMNVSHCYQPRLPDAEGAAVLERAVDLGYQHFDTAAAYGAGHNEQLIGRTLGHCRDEILISTKCGLELDDAGGRTVNNHPDRIRRSCEQSLRHLRRDAIDLFYLHRWDKKTPIVEVVGAMADLVRDGKVRAIGLSEVSAETLRKAHAEHPIAALQSEYSLWTRNPEIAALEACRELGVAFVAFSPLARQFLTGALQRVDGFCATDIRRTMPRFEANAYAANLRLLQGYADVAATVGCTMAQLALAWLLSRGDHVVPIPGTQNLSHLTENVSAAEVTIPEAALDRLDRLINEETVIGPRYNPAAQAQVDTEAFD